MIKQCYRGKDEWSLTFVFVNIQHNEISYQIGSYQALKTEEKKKGNKDGWKQMEPMFVEHILCTMEMCQK